MSAGEAGFDYIIERERGLRRDLTARRMTMIAIGGAIGTGRFLGSGFAIGLAGPGVLASYVIGALSARPARWRARAAPPPPRSAFTTTPPTAASCRRGCGVCGSR